MRTSLLRSLAIASALRRLPLFSVLLSLCACGPVAPAPQSETGPGEDAITVFAAASLTEVLTRLASDYTLRTGIPVRISFAASSTLARQIQSGARADIFVSADSDWMDSLERERRIVSDSRRNLVSNSLVLIAPVDAGFEAVIDREFPIGEAFDGRLAIGDPSHVPAGRYARQSLDALGWWPAIEDRILPAADVRDALRLVSMNVVGAGVVYSTDAASTDRVKVLGVFPPETHEPIVYPSALMSGAAPPAREFLDSLFGAEATGVFEAAGFIVPRPD